MFGFLFGMLCLFGLFASLRHARYGYCGQGGGWGGGWGQRRHGFGFGFGSGRGRGRRRPRFLARWLFEQLDTTPGQERAISRTMDDLREHVSSGRGEFTTARKEVAQAFGGDVLDAEVLNGALGRIEALLAKTKADFSQALLDVHSVLDGRQRKELAELIAEGPENFRYGYGR
jgi:Spy/CpxP family protein refolding chaperone